MLIIRLIEIIVLFAFSFINKYKFLFDELFVMVVFIKIHMFVIQHLCLDIQR